MHEKRTRSPRGPDVNDTHGQAVNASGYPIAEDMKLSTDDDDVKTGNEPTNRTEQTVSASLGMEAETADVGHESNDTTEQVVPLPLITGWGSFTAIIETFSFKDNKETHLNAIYIIYLVVDETNTTVYYGSLNIPKLEISLEQARNPLKIIPENEIYPPMPPELSAPVFATMQPPG